MFVKLCKLNDFFGYREFYILEISLVFHRYQSLMQKHASDRRETRTIVDKGSYQEYTKEE